MTKSMGSLGEMGSDHRQRGLPREQAVKRKFSPAVAVIETSAAPRLFGDHTMKPPHRKKRIESERCGQRNTSSWPGFRSMLELLKQERELETENLVRAIIEYLYSTPLPSIAQNLQIQFDHCDTLPLQSIHHAYLPSSHRLHRPLRSPNAIPRARHPLHNSAHLLQNLGQKVRDSRDSAT